MTKQSSKDDLQEYTNQELIEKIIKLESHVFQLQNILKNDNFKKNSICSSTRFNFNKYNKRRIALKILYLGWDYMGFATQEDNSNSIEDKIFEAMLKTKLIESRDKSNYHRCGRTDKGVSAFGQVISLTVRSNLNEGIGVIKNSISEMDTNDNLKNSNCELPYSKMLNGILPKDIRVLAWCPVDEDFSARFSCKSRTYKYFFPLSDLSIESMKTASKYLIGDFDFRNFCKMDIANNVTNYKRSIQNVNLRQIPMNSMEDYSICELTVVGQAFLWHQIRCIVSVLLLIGKRKEKPEVIKDMLDIEKNPRKPQYTMASELPLILFDCEFDGINWIFDHDVIDGILNILKEKWAKNQVKNSMLYSMIEKLECGNETIDTTVQTDASKTAIKSLTNWLNCDNKCRCYRPLLERPTCDSLEERLNKRRKLKKMDKLSTDF